MNLPGSQKLILPPEACTQNPDIGREPASNFVCVLAAGRKDTLNLTTPQFDRGI
jgi:hypothetical protein